VTSLGRSARRLLLVLLTVACVTCGPPAWIDQPPRFPAGAEIWELPLYEPLTRIGPHVVATAVGGAAGGPPPTRQVLLYVDSGSSHGALLADTFARLGVATAGSRFVTIEDAAGAKHGWSGALLPALRFDGGLTIADLPTSVTDYEQVLGADALGARGWQVDLDAGILRLGAEPWPEAPDVLRPPTRRWGDHAFVDVVIGGQPVPLLLDTGAPFTVVDGAVLRRLGLVEQPLASRWPLGGAGRKVTVETSFEGPVALGGQALGRRRIFAHPGGLSDGQGMLGDDILYDYTFQLTRDGLALRSRPPDLLSSTPRRIARWRDLPSCPGAPGCLAADLVDASGERPRIRVRFTAVPPRPFRYLFGCLDAQGRLRAAPFWVEVAVRQPAAGVAVDITVDPEAPPAFRRMWASGCARLGLLDANPIVEGARPLPVVSEAHLALWIRGVSFR
jgi:hypothetical protein